MDYVTYKTYQYRYYYFYGVIIGTYAIFTVWIMTVGIFNTIKNVNCQQPFIFRLNSQKQHVQNDR